jgi:hypothetical protein
MTSMMPALPPAAVHADEVAAVSPRTRPVKSDAATHGRSPRMCTFTIRCEGGGRLGLLAYTTMRLGVWSQQTSAQR